MPKLKASDISDREFLDAVKQACDMRRFTFATRWDVASILAGYSSAVGTDDALREYPNMPRKVVIAKARKLIKRGRLDGCYCGCRGDFVVIPERFHG